MSEFNEQDLNHYGKRYKQDDVENKRARSVKDETSQATITGAENNTQPTSIEDIESNFEWPTQNNDQFLQNELTESSNANEINENQLLNSIASLLENATESNKKQDSDTVLHDGLNVPANSELLNTNAALAAYKSISRQMPPLAVLAQAHLAALPMPIIANDYLPPRIQLLVNSLPTLDNLSSQLLRIIAIGPYQKIVDIALNPDTPAGATFRDLTSLFEFTKRLYSEEDPFLTVEHLAPGMWKEGDKTPLMFRNREQSIELTLRKVNLATFLSATLGTIEVGFFYLNESFLDVFCPINNLNVESALSNMGINTMSLQSGVNTTIGEKVGKLLKPLAILYLDLKTQAYISAIEAGERSKEEILEDILPHNMEDILLTRRGTRTLSPTEVDFIDRCKSRKLKLLKHEDETLLGEEYEWFAFLKDLFEYVGKNMGYIIWGKKTKLRENATPHSQEIIDQFKESDSREVVLNTTNPTGAEITNITNALLPSEIIEQQIHLRINPTSSKTLNRRPWTRDEEKALRHALELKGPQWSVILELFGNGGKISEALKNRSQVQLKDKARNWKMFFLKSGLPVPGYLMRVTGDLIREEKKNARQTRNEKTAAAPVPSIT